jgi:hypothetical protein
LSFALATKASDIITIMVVVPMKRPRPEAMSALPQQPVPSPPQPVPSPPPLDEDALCSYCEQLDDYHFQQEREDSNSSAADSQQALQARPPLRPVHPVTGVTCGVTEVICWRRRRAQPKRAKQAHYWSPPPPEPPPQVGFGENNSLKSTVKGLKFFACGATFCLRRSAPETIISPSYITLLHLLGA